MFDLTQELSLDSPNKTHKSNASKKAPKKDNKDNHAGVTLFYKNKQCRALVQEACRFEGWEEPKCFKDQPHKVDKSQVGNIVIVDLCGSDSLISEAESINAVIPNSKAVIIIGTEDKIQTLRQLEQLGFYYLLWPADKNELTVSLKQASQHQQRLLTSGFFRKAKRISMIGSRGGIGTSVFSTELASALSKKGSHSILVDHHFEDSNIDIILSRKDLDKTDINTITVELSQIDEESASNYLAEVDHGFHYLGLVGDTKQETLENYTTTLSEKLERQANFIIEDYSASIDFALNVEQVVKSSDVLVILLEPSVAAVRSTQKMLEKINEVGLIQSERPRIITALNHQRPINAFNLNKQEVEKFIKRPIDIEIPFYKQAATQLIEGKRLIELEKGKNRPVTNLVKSVNGEVIGGGNSLLSKLFSRGKS
jgi:pilus assembly protein CpaE